MQTTQKPTEPDTGVVNWVGKLRRDGLSCLGDRNTNLIRESIAREGIARAVILPKAKEVFGSDLRAFLLFGSAQLGVRKSISKSDIDCIMVVNARSEAQARSLLDLARKT
jgi:hypothetical protein